jgi:F-type H+-transporting ATPase subunit b
MTEGRPTRSGAPRRFRSGRIALSFLLAALLLLVWAPSLRAQEHGEHGSGSAEPLGAPQAEHAKVDAHGEKHGAEHVPHFSDINWMYGFLLEREGVEPSILFRPKGMQPPLGAALLNFGILVWVVVRYGRAPLGAALKKRRQAIMQGMDEAAKMKDKAADRLTEYEDKLSHVDDEIERVKREMKQAGEAERVRILAEAKERRARLEREARVLVEQELKAAREELMRTTVEGAMKSAADQIARELGSADHQRLADEYLAGLDTAVVNARGGKA